MENSKNTPFVQFIPAQLFTGKTWFVQYSVVNPYSGQMVRKRIKINRIKEMKERRRYAKRLIGEINLKLYSGWNPFQEQEVPRGFTKLLEVCHHFLKQKTKELRPDSMRSYQSFVQSFEAWLLESDQIECFCLNFNQQMARDYMRYIYDEKNVSNRTFNNYRRFQLILFNWMVENQFIKINPFVGIKPKKARHKKRQPVPDNERGLIKDYLMKTDFDFYMVTQLVFYTLLRPKEICQLKPEYFDLKSQTLIIPAGAAKNGNERIVTIPDALVQDLTNWNFNQAKPGQYIFGKGIKPGMDPLDARRLSKKWAAMRKKLNLSDDLVLYSLRDTGIIQMLRRGISPNEVMKQADHSSLEITTIYLKHANPSGSEEIKKRSDGF